MKIVQYLMLFMNSNSKGL